MSSTSNIVPPEKTGKPGRPPVYARDSITNKPIRPAGAPKQKYSARKKAGTGEAVQKATVSAPKRKNTADAPDMQAGSSKKQKCKDPEIGQERAGSTLEDLERNEEESEGGPPRSPTPEIISITANTIFLDTLDHSCFKPCTDEFWAVMYSKEGKGRAPYDAIKWTTHPRHVREAAGLMKAMRPQFCEWMEKDWWPEEMKRLASENVQKMLDEAWGHRAPDQEMVTEPKWELLEIPFELSCEL
ncbi:uncharacterized protein EKO05_0000906 [Ascochyta rabiei]|uniref:Uncharacterized protein n=1 Tax=Didymella rabiei TaxID=5454 RepID=A0A163MJ44_DIDRA|nr:uncharacterized protein EKO05_0000906 [Ascochyta rabiei]KZM28764.1 hypothetical protein ST47_g96 [Ascochyta rabiei]UPX10238.1 hypothetical protein EKO05_0000906 [Ascochyta rabiei]